MTAQELLAQNAADYMNEGQVAFFKNLLLEKSETLRERIATNQQMCLIDRQADDADAASIEEDREKATLLIELAIRNLKQVTSALNAIAEGDYGFCHDTGEPITLRRLLLVPESLLCVDAMQARELRDRHKRAA
jgi:DnaK suppressor protein